MGKKRVLRVISGLMLLAAAAFALCAALYPQFGLVIHIGRYELIPDRWREAHAAHAVYAALMAGLFAASFFVKEDKGGRQR